MHSRNCEIGGISTCVSRGHGQGQASACGTTGVAKDGGKGSRGLLGRVRHVGGDFLRWTPGGRRETQVNPGQAPRVSRQAWLFRDSCKSGPTGSGRRRRPQRCSGVNTAPPRHPQAPTSTTRKTGSDCLGSQRVCCPGPGGNREAEGKGNQVSSRDGASGLLLPTRIWAIS